MQKHHIILLFHFFYSFIIFLFYNYKKSKIYTYDDLEYVPILNSIFTTIENKNYAHIIVRQCQCPNILAILPV